MKKENNRGFSLIELIAVIAIMAIAMGIMSYSLNLIASARSKGCAEEIRSALELQRTNAMAKGESAGVTTIKKDSSTGAVMLQKGSGGTFEEIGSSSLTITYGYKNDTTVYTLGADTSSETIVVTFNSASGSIKDTHAIEWIRISGNKTYRIELAKLTGKVTMTTE